ncbi:hypothetical protein K440DRAFT_621191 [Wilcoxina mikolae CBS 423.85]|nr:hypothetical protein K440DRAFT_621191 [Wilcoxina mikolae CBS 423.85]
MIEGIKEITGNTDDEVLPDPSTKNLESNFLLNPQMAAFIEDGKDIHPEFGCLGKLYAANTGATATTASIIYKNLWGDSKEDKEYLNEFLKKAGYTYLHILREQVELLPIEGAQLGSRESIPEISEQEAHMDPHTGEFVAPPRKVVSEYDKYGSKISKTIEDMLNAVYIKLNGQLPTYSAIEYMSNASGLSAATIRGWWVARGGRRLGARTLLKNIV